MNQPPTLHETLERKKDGVVHRWHGLITEAHPGGAKFFQNIDQFTNPVGYVLFTETGVLYDALMAGELESETVVDSLNSIARITAVQDYSPGQAVGFVFQLKVAIREALKKELREMRALQELTELDLQIDKMAVLGFEAYTRCREKIHQVRSRELRADRDNAFRLLDKPGFRGESTEES